MSNYSAIGMLAILLIFLVGFVICIFRRRYMVQRGRHDEQYFSDDVDHYLAREPFAVVVAAAQDGRLAGDGGIGGRGSSRAGPAAEGVVLPNTLYHPAVLSGRVLSGVNNTNTNTNNTTTSTYATAAITGISGYYGNPLQSNLPVALPAFVDETGQPVLHHLSSEDEADRNNNNTNTGARTAGGGQGGSGVYGEAYYLPRPAEAKEDYTVLVDDTDEKDEEDEEEEDKVKRRKEEEHKTGDEAANGTAETTTSAQTAGVVDRTASEGTMQVAPHETKGQLQRKKSKGNKDS